MSAKAATDMIQKKRRPISINEHFYNELVEYENSLKNIPHNGSRQMC
jgi:hypothetical protein